MAAVTIDGLRVVRGGKEVLPGLSLEFEAGVVVGLLGPSGCGKTTLMRSIVGVQRVQGGRVTVLGRPAGSPELRGRVGYMPQGTAIYNDLTPRENLRYFCHVLRAPLSNVDRVIESAEVKEFANQLTGRLSGGQCARVSLAIALLNDPELLVLDEPTVGLDPALRRDLWQFFHSLTAKGKTLLISSHVMDEAERCDRLVLMRDGRMLASGAPCDLMARTRTGSVEQAFLSLIEETKP